MDLFKLAGEIVLKGADEAERDIDSVTESGESAKAKIGKAFGGMGKDSEEVGGKFNKLGGMAKAVGTGIVAAFSVSAFSNWLTESQEVMEDMGKLETAFTTSGFSAETAHKSFEGMVGILGETDQSVEAVNHLAKLANSEEELAQWTDIAAGVYATFGDSLPLEGLTEAANETAKVGQVTGPFADALNWATQSTDDWNKALEGHPKAQAAMVKGLEEGLSAEDAFNLALAECTDETERSALITQAMGSVYGEVGQKYQENNKALIEAREAQAKMAEASAKAAEQLLPLKTAFQQLLTDGLNHLMPAFEKMGSWITANLPAIKQQISDTFEKMQPTFSALGATISTVAKVALPPLKAAFDGIMAVLPPLVPVILAAVAGFKAYQGVSAIITGVKNAQTALKTTINLVKTATIAQTVATKAATVAAKAQAVASKAVAAAQKLVNAAMKANPIGIVITVIAALIAIFVALFKNNEDFKNKVIAIWNAIKSTALSVFGAIGNFIKSVWNGIKSVTTSVWNGIKSAVTKAFNGIKSTATSVWNGIKTAISTPINAAKSLVFNAVGAIKSKVSSVFNSIKSTVSSVWNGIKTAITNPINAAKSLVSNAVNKIKGIINGAKLSLPHFKLPHFNISGGQLPWGIGGKGTRPTISVDWYAKGAIFDKPTLFSTPKGTKGVGEAGPEAVSPVSVLQDYVRTAVAEQNEGLAELLQGIAEMLAEYLPQMATMQMVTDTGALVGAIAPKMDRALGARKQDKARGR